MHNIVYVKILFGLKLSVTVSLMVINSMRLVTQVSKLEHSISRYIHVLSGKQNYSGSSSIKLLILTIMLHLV